MDNLLNDKKYIEIKDNLDIRKYMKLTVFLKSNSDRFKGKKSKVLSKIFDTKKLKKYRMKNINKNISSLKHILIVK